MEKFLLLFEQAIQKQIELVGEEVALNQARMAGLGTNEEGHIVSCAGNPQLVLMRLIKFFTAGGNLMALAQCTPLINEMLRMYGDESENSDQLTEKKKVSEPV